MFSHNTAYGRNQRRRVCFVQFARWRYQSNARRRTTLCLVEFARWRHPGRSLPFPTVTAFCCVLNTLQMDGFVADVTRDLHWSVGIIMTWICGDGLQKWGPCLIEIWGRGPGRYFLFLSVSTVQKSHKQLLLRLWGSKFDRTLWTVSDDV